MTMNVREQSERARDESASITKDQHIEHVYESNAKENENEHIERL